MFTLIGILTNPAVVLSNDIIEDKLRGIYGRDPGCVIKRERLPFSKTETLALWWGNWLIGVNYDAIEVEKEIEGIAKVLGPRAPEGLAGANRLIRVVFSDDPEKGHTNDIIFMMEFLDSIDGCVIFDPQKVDIFTFD